MKNTAFTLSLIILFGIDSIYGQDKTFNYSYDRIALTVVYVNDPQPGNNMSSVYGNEAKDFFSISSIVPEKYDDHGIPTKVITYDLSEISAGNTDQSNILAAVVQAGIPRQMIEKWFHRADDGSFNMDLIKKRGLYNAKDNDVIMSMAAERQKAILEDMGEKLITKNYLILINCTEVQPLKKSDGKLYYQGSAIAYVYRLVWDEETSSQFYNNMWINADDNLTTKTQRKGNFDKTDFKVEFVNTVKVSKDQALTLLLNTYSDEAKLQLLFAELGKGLIDKLVTVGQEFNIKQNLTASNPPAASIGSKEGLFIDQRYFVYETVQGSKNQLIDRRRSVIRVKKISDNSSESQGNTEPSIFYRVAGGKVDHYGMFLKEKNDHGFSVSANYLIGGIGGIDISVTYNLSSLISKSLDVDLPPGINFYGEYGFDSEYYTGVAYEGTENYNFGRFSIGLLKDNYFGNIFHTTAKVGFGMENTELTGNAEVEDQVNFSGKFILAGGRLGINLLHNVQLVGGLNYYFPFGKATIKYGSGDPKEDPNGFTDYFEDRKGISIVTGLKIII